MTFSLNLFQNLKYILRNLNSHNLDKYKIMATLDEKNLVL